MPKLIHVVEAYCTDDWPHHESVHLAAFESGADACEYADHYHERQEKHIKDDYGHAPHGDATVVRTMMMYSDIEELRSEEERQLQELIHKVNSDIRNKLED